MKQLFVMTLICGFCLAAIGSNAQETEGTKGKQTKKEQRELIRKQNVALIASAIDSSAFVLEADRLQSKRGFTINVPSNLNFIAVDGDSGFIQIGSNSAIGPNGVGGISVNTRITKMTVDKNEKHGSYSIHLSCISNAGMFDIFIDCSDDGQIATASVGGNWGGKLTYLGELVPLSLSRVYKGTPLF